MKFNLNNIFVHSGIYPNEKTGEPQFKFLFENIPVKYEKGWGTPGFMRIENVRGVKDIEGTGYGGGSLTFGLSYRATLTGGDINIDVFFIETEGDLDGDGKTDVSDVVKIRNWIMGSVTATPEQRAKADLDGDGKIDVSDIVKLRNIIMGITE